MTRLYKYQKQSVKRLLKLNGRALLALEMGLGKTLVALTYLKQKAKQRPVLVVCPSTAKYVWKNEIRKHTRFSGRILSGRKPKIYKNDRDITIINYDIVHYWRDHLRRQGFKVMVLDECHYCKNWKAKRTKAVSSLGKRIPHIIAMSGTPLTNRPKELYPTLHLLLPNVFKSFVPYAFRYCGRRMTPWGWDDTRATHIDELHKRLKKNCMIRRTKKEVLTDLPDKTRMVVPIEIELSEYDKAEKEFVQWFKKLDDKKQMAEALQKLGFMKQLAAKLKMKYVFDWLDAILEDSDGKVVVFAYHKAIISMLKERYENSVVVDGSVRGKERQDIVDRFQTDDRIRLFIGQIVAAGTAITLTAASTAVFVELDWVPANHIQAEDRIHRIGQTNKAFIYYLVAKNTIEERLCHVLQQKFNIVTSILDGEGREDELDIFDRLMKFYERF